MTSLAELLLLYAQQFEDQHAPQNITIAMREAAVEIERQRGTVLELLGQVGQLSDEITRLRAEVAKLREALEKMLAAVCGTTGFAAAVRQASGLAYPWPHLDAAERIARAALALKEKADD